MPKPRCEACQADGETVVEITFEPTTNNPDCEIGPEIWNVCENCYNDLIQRLWTNFNAANS